MKKYLLILFISFSGQTYSQCFTTQSSWYSAFGCQPGIIDSAGTIQLIMTGGTPPYTVYRQVQFADTIITNDTAVFYGLWTGDWEDFYIRDAIGCSDVASVDLMYQPSPFQLIATPPSCMNCCDGTVYAVPVRPISPDFQFYWYPSGDTNLFQSNICPGTYVELNGNYLTSGCYSYDYVVMDSVRLPSDSISGHVFVDTNGNGVQDALEPAAPNVFISVNPVNGFALTGVSGDYLLRLPPGSYQITATPPPGWQITSSPATYNVNLNGFAGNLDFGINMPGNNGSISVNAFNDWPRCNQNVKHYIEVINTSPVAFDSVTVQFNYSSNMTFTYASPVISSSTGNTLEWTLGAMQPLSDQILFAFFNLPGAGNLVNYAATVSAWIGGAMVATNTYSTPVTIACSFDPNDIAVTPQGTGAQHYVPMGQNFEYLIRFQNSGNDTAYDISVNNPIDASLDLSTFRLLSSSHPVDVINLGNLIKFNFNHIMLPDSNRDEPGSNGYVRYSISPKTNLPDPTVINNAALIYFDQNDPVATNSTTNTLSNLLGIGTRSNKKISVSVFPNPASDHITIQWPKNVICGELSLIDSRGVVLINKSNPSNSTIFNLSDYPNGTYFIRFADKSGSYSGLKTFIKQ